jgi:DNA-binding MarR family transcriptional regulator
MPISPTDIRRLPGLLHLLHFEVGRRSGGRGLQELHDLGLSMPQVIAMHVLLQSADASRLETEGLGMHALGEALRLSPSAITTLVDKLVERQLVERWENPGDRRQKQVRLRPAGIELLDRMAQYRAAEFSEALGDIDPSLQVELLDVLQRVVHALDTTPTTD